MKQYPQFFLIRITTMVNRNPHEKKLLFFFSFFVQSIKIKDLILPPQNNYVMMMMHVKDY